MDRAYDLLAPRASDHLARRWGRHRAQHDRLVGGERGLTREGQGEDHWPAGAVGDAVGGGAAAAAAAAAVAAASVVVVAAAVTAHVFTGRPSRL